jgi:hypothetical protein
MSCRACTSHPFLIRQVDVFEDDSLDAELAAAAEAEEAARAAGGGGVGGGGAEGEGEGEGADPAAADAGAGAGAGAGGRGNEGMRRAKTVDYQKYKKVERSLCVCLA